MSVYAPSEGGASPFSQVTASSIIAARLAKISPEDCQNEIDGHELLIADLKAEIFEIRAATTLEPVSKQA